MPGRDRSQAQVGSRKDRDFRRGVDIDGRAVAASKRGDSPGSGATVSTKEKKRPSKASRRRLAALRELKAIAIIRFNYVHCCVGRRAGSGWIDDWSLREAIDKALAKYETSLRREVVGR